MYLEYRAIGEPRDEFVLIEEPKKSHQDHKNNPSYRNETRSSVRFRMQPHPRVAKLLKFISIMTDPGKNG